MSPAPHGLRRRLSMAALAFATLALVCAPAVSRAQEPLTIFAAASLTDAFETLGKAWKDRGGTPVRFSFAASSALAKQIEQGAPAAVFVSADEQWMDYLVERKRIVEGTRAPFVRNQLVLIVPADRAANLDLKPGADLAGFLKGGRLTTGDPGHVPVGRYAQSALTWLGVWDAVAPGLVRADSVRVALSYVERGEVAAGIVYSTDAAITPKVRVAGTFPPQSHAPISYPIGVVTGPDEARAREFVNWVRGPEARTILRRYGFGDP